MVILKEHLLALIKGYQIRKALLVLERLVKQFVQSDDNFEKDIVRREFTIKFEQTMAERLYLKIHWKEHLGQEGRLQMSRSTETLTNLYKNKKSGEQSFVKEPKESTKKS